MTHLCEENMRRVADFVAGGGRLSHAMNAIGAHEKLIWTWLRRDDAKMLVRYPTMADKPVLFRDALSIARRQHICLLESQFRTECTQGVPRTVVESGRVAFTLDPLFIGWSDDEMRALGFSPHERYLRDARGRAIPLVVYDAAPAHQKIHAIKSLVPAYNPTNNTSVEARLSGGVRIITNAVEAVPLKEITMSEETTDTKRARLMQELAALDAPDRITSPTHPVVVFKDDDPPDDQPEQPAPRVQQAPRPRRDPEDDSWRPVLPGGARVL